ncbi:MAG: hypothetical protein O7C61_00460, partial [SAR324 cluster bacterium]|nr:hypothetical protein [SAR324 cluster bacterium]
MVSPAGPETASARPLDGRAITWMVGLTFIWGLDAVTVKVITLGVTPMMGAALRGAIALVLLTIHGRLWGAAEFLGGFSRR